MSALEIKVDLGGLPGVEARLRRLDPLDKKKLLWGLAWLIREQTRHRILAGGPAPDGSAWKPNREGRAPILHRSGALARSIDRAVQGSSVVVGSGLVYSAIHQFGGVIKAKNAERLAFRIGNRFFRPKQVTMPARPYLGLSAEDKAELQLAARNSIRKVLG